MANQTNFDWGEFNRTMGDERAYQQQQRAAKDTRDQTQVNKIVGATENQAYDRAEREAARQAGVYDKVYGQESGTDPYGAYTSDITGLDPYKYAQNELKKRNEYQQVAYNTAAPWETGTLAPGQRQAGEKASPWDSLNKQLGNVAAGAEQRRANLNQRYSQDKQDAETAAFNAKEKAKQDNDYARKQANDALWNEFNQMVERYSQQARGEQSRGRQVTVEPYTSAMDEFVKKYGSEPPDPRQLTTNSAVIKWQNEHMVDPERAGQSAQQALLQRRLTDPSYGLTRNDGWSYGSGSDTSGWWGL